MFIAALLITIAQAPLPDRIESLPVIAELPDPFELQDGRRVERLSDWPERRAEMLELVLRYEYGNVPKPPRRVRAGDITLEEDHQAFRLWMGPGDGFPVRTQVYLPRSGDGPFPVVVRFGLDGKRAKQITDRGYAYVCFEHRELDPDTSGYDVPGPAQAAYPQQDWGALGAWAWGASRVLDYLETLPEIDTKRSVITGHSRTGKAALLTGALDERFAIVVPNGSGCGGAGTFRGATNGVETLKLITLEDRFKSWFRSDFGDFGDHVERLPFDQHFMRALITPRVVLNTDALGDTWANPLGTQRAWLAAQPVYEFLGVGDRNLCHFREGGHDQLAEDMDVLLDVADWHFGGKALTRSFDVMPDAAMTRDWSWEKP